MNFLRLLLLASGFALAVRVSAVEPVTAWGARFTPIADNAFAGSSVNVVANSRHSLFTHKDDQYAAYYDADGFMVLAKRHGDATTWQTQRTIHPGNVADAHNSISLVVDGGGFLHVSWDHHVNPLNYARSGEPGSLVLGAPERMTGERESHVTYPQFFDLPNGDLLFLYRDGSSGRGALALNRYSVATQTWTAVQPNLIDGQGKRSPYWGMTVDRQGTLHLAWIWRDSPDVASNHDIGYARSRDGGVTWTRADSTACEMPLTVSNCEYAVRIPTSRNLMNSPVIVSDDAGNPLVMSYWSPTPDSPPQFQIAKHDGAKWSVHAVAHPLTAFSLGGSGTKRPPISRGVLFVQTIEGKTAAHVVYRDDSRGGRGVAVTTNHLEGGRWLVTDLTSDDCGAWEPSFDPVRWERTKRFHSLLQHVRQLDGNDRTAAESAPSTIGVLSWNPTIALECCDP